MSDRKPQALIADDDSLVRWALTRALTAEGFEVSTASSRAEALSRMVGAPIVDVVVASPSLGREDVRDLVEQVCRNRPATGVVLLVDEKESAAVSGDWGKQTALVEKPFALDDLMSAVRRCVAMALAGEPTAEPDGEPGAEVETDPQSGARRRDLS